MAANEATRGAPQDAAPDVRHQQIMLLELLDPPAYGKSPRTLARRIRISGAETRAAAAALESKGLAIVQDDHVAASGPAIDFDALWPIAL